MLSYRINNFLRHTYACTISNCRSFASTNVETGIIIDRDISKFLCFFLKQINIYLSNIFE